MKTMKRSEALKYIQKHYGEKIWVSFIKRTTGEIREMCFTQGVKAGLVENPTKEGVDFKANKLLAVYDEEKYAYRSIPIEGITGIKIDGEWQSVV